MVRSFSHTALIHDYVLVILTSTDGVPMLQNLRVEHIHNEGYASLRCCWSLGCPSEIQPGRIGGPDRTETYYTEAFKTLFPNDIAPDVVGAPCCAQ